MWNRVPIFGCMKAYSASECDNSVFSFTVYSEVTCGVPGWVLHRYITYESSKEPTAKDRGGPMYGDFKQRDPNDTALPVYASAIVRCTTSIHSQIDYSGIESRTRNLASRLST